MARIPVYDTPAPEARGISSSAPSLDNGNGAEQLGRGFAQVGAAAEQTAKYSEAKAKEATDKAHAISQANADAAYQRAETAHLVGGSNRGQLIDNAFNAPADAAGVDVGPGDVEQTPGYLSTRGIEASKQAGAVVDSLDKARQQIAKDNFADEEQRQAWLARSNGMLASSEQKVANHAAQQFNIASEDALKGKLATTLQAIADDTNGSQTAQLMASAEQSIRKLQESPAGGDAAILKLQHEAVKVRIERLVSDGNVDVAERQLQVAKGSKAGLGTDGPEIERMVAQARLAQDRKAASYQDEVLVAGMLKEARGTDGYIDENKALSAVDESYPEKRHELRALMHTQLAVEAEKKKNDIEGWRNTAQGAFNAGGLGAVNAATDAKGQSVRELLHQYDPAFEAKLMNEAELRWRRARADHSGDAAERRAQAEANHRARNDYLSMPLEERAVLNIDTEFMGSGANPLGVSELKRLQQVDKGNIQTNAAQGEADFMRTALAAVQDKGYGKNETKNFKAEAVLAFQQFFEKNKRRPSAAETSTEIATLIQNGETEPGFFYGYNAEPEWKRRQRERQALGKGEEPQQPPALTLAKNKQAADWAHAHPADPRSAAILKKLGVQ